MILQAGAHHTDNYPLTELDNITPDPWQAFSFHVMAWRGIILDFRGLHNLLAIEQDGIQDICKNLLLRYQKNQSHSLHKIIKASFGH